tara:strand:- start:10901 stop:11215 length:315 start_codon:yes stop_codon:yes gene_type:complete
MKTSELTGIALDWAVAECQGHDFPAADAFSGIFNPSTEWSQGGPIIERENIGLTAYHRGGGMAWRAVSFNDKNKAYGPTPLIAAMRCYVASKMGDDIELSEGLA